jgi:hypothetical protein
MITFSGHNGIFAGGVSLLAWWHTQRLQKGILGSNGACALSCAVVCRCSRLNNKAYLSVWLSGGANA